MLSAASTRIFDASSSNATAVTATATADASPGVQTINRVLELARAPEMSGTNHVSRPLQGVVPASASIALSGRSLALMVDGVRREITFTRDYLRASELPLLVADLNTALEGAFGRSRVVATEQGGTLTFNMHNALGAVVPSTARLEVQSAASDAAPLLGLVGGQSNRVSLNARLDAATLATPLSFPPARHGFSINNVAFDFGADATLADVMRTVNQSTAGVAMSYNSVTDSFTLRGSRTGATERITLAQTAGNLLAGLGMTPSSVAGTNLVTEINGLTVRRGSNSFVLDGVSYTFHALQSTSATITIRANADRAVANVREFVTQYNKVLAMLNGELREDRDASFLPLTDTQREAMSEAEIKLWEERAKSGLLRNNPLLQRLVSDLRRAVADVVAGAGINMADVGISTRHFHENGRLHFDETRLRVALATNGEQVTRLFSRAADIAYSPNLTGAERLARREGSGVMWRLADAIEDNIRTTRDQHNRKGFFLERAGILGDASATRNVLAEQITRLNSRINQMQEVLTRKEDRYWRQFSALERAMSTMNSQSAWLASQFAPRQ
ncbi:MAG: hypothetical protein DDT35_01431 [Firmicutes bacterium]|nr:hypothetical protein [Bacillota bacterium]